MPYAKKLPNKQKMTKIILICSIALVLIVAGVFTYIAYKKNLEAKEAARIDALPRIVVPAGHFAPAATEYKYTFSDHLKSVKIIPKKDVYTDENATKETLEAEVDKIIEQIKALNFNGIVVDTKYDNKVIYANKGLQSTGVDLLEIISNKASENGLTVTAVFNAKDVMTQKGGLIASHLPYKNRDALLDAIADLATGYKLESILIDDFYAADNGQTYAQFISYGAIGSYDEWIKENVSLSVSELAQAVKTANNAMPVGLYVDSVWANKTANENGSATKSDFEELSDGFSDTKTLVESGAVDFVNVKVKTSTENSVVPFNTVVSWWSSVCKAASKPLYVTHYAENTVNKSLPGFNGTDQLARQALLASKVANFHGSTYSGFKELVADTTKNTENLIKYYNDQYNEKDLMTDLKITIPTKRSFVTYEESVQFRGTFDPNQEVKINGEKVEATQRGGFSVWVPLKVGKNVINIEHKGKVITYNIERKIVIFKSVSPTKDMKVYGGTTLEVNVNAYKGSKITATLNGKTITLTEGGGVENEFGSAYDNFRGSFKIPQSTNKEQNLGRIKFYGSTLGYAEAPKGANITIEKNIDDVDPDTMTGQVLRHATITRKYASTYPFRTTPAYPQAILYQLPYGTTDIIQSESGDYLHLRSGKTVKRNGNDLMVEEKPFEGNNKITKMTVGVEGNDTVIRMDMAWKSPFSVMPTPYPTSELEGKTSYQFASNRVEVLLDYTTYADVKQISKDLSQSPIFSDVSYERVFNNAIRIYQYKLVLTMRQAGRYYGCHAEWENNTLVLKFNHPPYNSGSLSGLTICLDVGHGGSDTGNTAGRDILEKDINLQTAFKVKSALESNGANVIMTRTGDETVSYQQRTEFAQNNGADLFISCHHNSVNGNSTAVGIETFYNSPFSKPLSDAVQREVASVAVANGSKDRGSKGYNFIVAREKQFPSILIEFGFLSNPWEEQLCLTDSYQQSLADAVAQGVINYYAQYN